MVLKVNSDSCIKCGKCVKVCPSDIFVQEKKAAPISLKDEDKCIVCGHCVAVCPSGSVQHSEFPATKIHPVDYNQIPSPDQMMLLLKARRSNRTLTNKPVPAEMLAQILEAAHRAPTASNSQSVGFTLITDPQKVRWIGNYTISVFDSLKKKLMNPLLKPILKPLLPDVYKYVPLFERMKQDHAEGKDPILRHATSLILIHTPHSNRFGCEDSNLAYQNASLMAECLGVSQIYMGFVLTAIRQDRKATLAKEFGIDGKIHAIMALGMPAFRYPSYIDRKEINITQF